MSEAVAPPPPAADPGTARSEAAGVGSAPAGPAARRYRHRRGAVAATAFASGVGVALSLPPWGWWVVAFPSAGLLWWRIEGERARSRFLAGWLAGIGCFGIGLWWSRSFSVPGAVVLVAVESLFPAAACAAVPRRGGWQRAVAFPAAMTLAEAARQSWPFGGLPIGGPFLGQAGGPVLGVARVGGPLLVTAVVYLGGVAVAAGVLAGRRRLAERSSGAISGSRPATVIALAATGVVVASVVLGGVAPDGCPARSRVSVAAVQGGGVRGFRKSQVDPATVLAAALAATGRMEREDGGHNPQLVLWPEDVVSLATTLGASGEEGALSSLAATLHTTLVVGVTEDVSTAAFRNEVVAFGPDGALVARYEKVHRVPFGEYVPYRGFFSHLANLSAVPRDAIPGHGSGLLRTPAGPLGAMISYEVFFSSRGRSSVRAGAQLLIVPTNTSSYATSQVPTQEVAASRFQAVEEGRDLLQAAPTGYTAVVTHRGAVLQRSVLGAPQVLFAKLGLRTGTTWFVRAGDTPVLALAGLTLLAAWAGIGSTLARRRWGASWTTDRIT